MATSAPSSSGASRGDLPAGAGRRGRGVKDKLAAEPKDIATRVGSEIALEALIAGAAGDGRRLGRPHRLEQHAHQGDARR